MKIASLLTVLFYMCAITPVVAEDKYDYELVKAGDIVLYDGVLFTNEGMSKAVASTQAKVRLIEVQKMEELQKVKIALQNIIDTKDSETRAKEEMYLKQLGVKQQTIEALVTDSHWSNIKIVSGVVIGVAAGILVGIVATKLSN